MLLPNPGATWNSCYYIWIPGMRQGASRRTWLSEASIHVVQRYLAPSKHDLRLCSLPTKQEKAASFPFFYMFLDVFWVLFPENCKYLSRLHSTCKFFTELSSCLLLWQKWEYRVRRKTHVPLILLDSFRWLVLTPGWSSASADILHCWVPCSAHSRSTMG